MEKYLDFESASAIPRPPVRVRVRQPGSASASPSPCPPVRVRVRQSESVSASPSPRFILTLFRRPKHESMRSKRNGFHAINSMLHLQNVQSGLPLSNLEFPSEKAKIHKLNKISTNSKILLNFH